MYLLSIDCGLHSVAWSILYKKTINNHNHDCADMQPNGCFLIEQKCVDLSATSSPDLVTIARAVDAAFPDTIMCPFTGVAVPSDDIYVSIEDQTCARKQNKYCVAVQNYLTYKYRNMKTIIIHPNQKFIPSLITGSSNKPRTVAQLRKNSFNERKLCAEKFMHAEFPARKKKMTKYDVNKLYCQSKMTDALNICEISAYCRDIGTHTVHDDTNACTLLPPKWTRAKKSIYSDISDSFILAIKIINNVDMFYGAEH